METEVDLLHLLIELVAPASSGLLYVNSLVHSELVFSRLLAPVRLYLLSTEVEELVDIPLGDAGSFLVCLLSCCRKRLWHRREGSLVDNGPCLGLSFQDCLESGELAVEEVALVHHVMIVLAELVVLFLQFCIAFGESILVI